MIIERPAIFTLTDTQHIKGFSYRFGFGTATGHFRLPLFRITQVDNQCALSRSSNIYRNITCLPAKGKIFSACTKPTGVSIPGFSSVSDFSVPVE